MKNYLVVGLIVENEKGDVLLGKKKEGRIYPGCWIIPGGGVDEGEALEEAVKREGKEETGLELEVIKKISFDEDYMEKIERSGKKRKLHLIALNFLTRPIDGQLSPDDDMEELTWFPKEKLKDLKLAEITRRLFESLSWI